MFSNKEFQSFAGESTVLFASVMTKIEGRKDDELLRTYGFRGFPSMAILDASGEKKFDSLPRDVYGMRCVLGSVDDYLALKDKVDAGETVDEKAWFLARLGVGEVDVSSARKELESLGWLSPRTEASS